MDLSREYPDLGGRATFVRDENAVRINPGIAQSLQQNVSRFVIAND